jgi:STE24 endopeptidase
MELSGAPFPYLEAVVGFMIFMYTFETLLDIRQHAALKLKHLPAPLYGVVSQEKFEKAQAYSLDKSQFHFVHAAVNIIEESAILLLGLLPWAWDKSGSLLSRLGFDPTSEILHTLSFLAVTTLWSQILELPFSLYSTFVIEARHGFNKQTIWLFFSRHGHGIGAHGGRWPSDCGCNYLYCAERRPVSCSIPLGVHVGAVACDDGALPRAHRSVV